MKSKLFIKLFCFAMIGWRGAGMCQERIVSQDSAAVQQIASSTLSAYRGQRTIDAAIADPRSHQRNEVVIARTDGSEKHKIQSNGPVPGVDLRQLAANVSIIVEVTPLERKSFICADNTFVCSNYTALVTRVIRNNGVAVLAGQQIVISRGGGVVKYNGSYVRAIDPNFHLFKLNTRYIFFLKLIPGAGIFKAYPFASFELNGNDVIDGRNQVGKLTIDRAAFLSHLQEASTFSIGDNR